MTKMTRWLRFTLWLLFVVLVVSLGDESRDGVGHYNEGIRLANSDRLDEAAMEFWKAVLKHNGEAVYKAADAFQNFLFCYQRQGKLGLGYAFVAAQMHQMGDKRSLEYLKLAHQHDPTNPEILQLMEYMGETANTLTSLRRYSNEKDEVESMITDSQTSRPETCNTMKACVLELAQSLEETPALDSGWDDKTWRKYKHNNARLINTPEIQVTIPPLEEFTVAYNKFWYGIKDWEQSTFKIFSKYITSDTIVVDFGTWIGPTMLYHAQFSKQSYGMEADPFAYGEVMHNMKLNPSLAAKVIIEPVAVTAPQDAGVLDMKSSKLGNSETFLGRKDMRGEAEEFEVRGYTLPYIMAGWGIDLSSEHVFIKIDIESYECRLLPSFHEWLIDEPERNVTIFVSFHPQIQPCTRAQMKQVLGVFKLFSTVTCNEDKHTLRITRETSFEELEEMLDSLNCLTGKDNSDFVLHGRLADSD